LYLAVLPRINSWAGVSCTKLYWMKGNCEWAHMKLGNNISSCKGSQSHKQISSRTNRFWGVTCYTASHVVEWGTSEKLTAHQSITDMHTHVNTHVKYMGTC
jgi:hypothetical protein